MNILISSAGRRVSLIRAFKKELSVISPDSKVIASDAKPELSAACQVADDYFRMPRVGNEAYIELLLEHCIRLNIKIIIPTIDTELALFAENKILFEEKDIHFVISDHNLIKICRDKRLTHDFFTSKNIQVAKSYTKQNYKLPMFLKPWNGSRSVDTFLIKKESDLNEYHLNHENMMFLEYLDHELFDEYTCDLYYDKKNTLRCAVPRKRIEVRDGEVNKGVTENGYLVDYIKERMKHVDGAVGCITVQFFKHKKNNDIYGIEINPRFGGGYPLSYLAGANFPKNILMEYLKNQEIENSFDNWEDKLLMLRYDDEILYHGFES